MVIMLTSLSGTGFALLDMALIAVYLLAGQRGSRVSRRLEWISRWVGGHGVNVIELMLVLVITAALASRAAPIYLDYARSAKTAEAKALAGLLWTGVTGHALTACGKPAVVSNGYARAGLSTAGSTTPARWSVSADSKTITIDCDTGAITPDGDVFVISGTASDVTAIRVKLTHLATSTPTARLQCSGNAGVSFTDC